MSISVCLGSYAKTPYSIPGIEVDVFSIEELGYILSENAFLLDMSLMNDALVDWLDKECGLYELSRALHSLIHRKGELSTFVVTILNYVGMYEDDTVSLVDKVLKQGAGLSMIEKKKKQIDFLTHNQRFRKAIREYDGLIAFWRKQEESGGYLPEKKVYAEILHNKGVALAGMMMYKSAADCFEEAFECVPTSAYFKDYLAAKRMELPEDEYMELVSRMPETYEITIELEKDMEQIVYDWEESPEYLALNRRMEMRGGHNQQFYFEESDKLVRRIESAFRENTGC